MSKHDMIPFNKPFICGKEQLFINEVIQSGSLSGPGRFTERCHQLISNTLQGKPERVLLTPSCTAALEMCAILAGVSADDEVIMPSYTFVSTANAFVLRGAIPVFVDIRPDTLNIDESLIESAITQKTKAIVVVHYAGIACNMSVVMRLAEQYGLLVIEDAAQAIGARYNEQPLGTFGHLAAFSFHATKNIHCGEGGALVINDPSLAERAIFVWEKGTNRTEYLRGHVNRYSWVDIGSSFLVSELTAAFLYAQLLKLDSVTSIRLGIWHSYNQELSTFALVIPDDCSHNGHIFSIVLPNRECKERALNELTLVGIEAAPHYTPLHLSPAGEKFCRKGSDLSVTTHVAASSIRLPIHASLSSDEVSIVISETQRMIKDAC